MQKHEEKSFERDICLDFLKVICTILIVFHHYQMSFGNHFTYIKFWHHPYFYFGNIVEAFFLISGLLSYRMLMHNILSQGFSRFYVKRVKRLLPMAAITVVISQLIDIIHRVVYGCWIDDRTYDFWGGICTCLGIQAGWFVRNPGINYLLWYISVLLLCYLVMYICVWFAEKIGVRKEILFLSIIIVGIMINEYQIDLPFFNSYSCRGYEAFFYGLMIAKVLEDDKIIKNKFIKIVSILILVWIPFIVIHGYIRGINHILVLLFYPAVITIVKALPIKWWGGWTILSNISFEVYIWHGIFITLVKEFILNVYNLKMDCRTTMFAYLLVMYFVGALLYWGIEKRLSNYLNSFM